MATKRKESLEEGLSHSASKRGLSGKERHRYIGGALRNMEKKGEISLRKRSGGRSKAASSRPSTTAHASHKATPAPSPAPKKAAYSSPKLTKRETLVLTVKENKEASEKVPHHTYKLYSIYKVEGKKHTLYSPATYRKAASARAEAKIEMDAHNDIRGSHSRGKLA